MYDLLNTRHLPGNFNIEEDNVVVSFLHDDSKCNAENQARPG